MFSKFEGDTDNVLTEKWLHVSGYLYNNAKGKTFLHPFVNKMGASGSDEKWINISSRLATKSLSTFFKTGSNPSTGWHSSIH